MAYTLFVFGKISSSKPNFFINYHLCLIAVDSENQEPWVKEASQIQKPNDILFKTLSKAMKNHPAYDMLF